MVRSKSVTFLCVTLSILVGACSESAALRERCEPLAADGCPGNSLAVCADDACGFVASCDLATGRWVTVGECPRAAADGGVGDGGATSDGASDAAATADASRDAALDGGSSALCPPLQPPDCSETTRAACGAGCCGCEDVFACVRGGWEYVGPCVSP